MFVRRLIVILFLLPLPAGLAQSIGDIELVTCVSKEPVAILPRNTVFVAIGLERKNCRGSYLFIYSKTANSVTCSQPISESKVFAALGLSKQQADCSAIVGEDQRFW